MYRNTKIVNAHRIQRLVYVHVFTELFPYDILTLTVLVATIDAQWEGMGLHYFPHARP